MPVEVTRRLLKWGNGFGLRITAKEAALLGVRDGAVVHATLDAEGRVDNRLSEMAMFDLGGVSARHDELLGAGYIEDAKPAGSRRRS